LGTGTEVKGIDVAFSKDRKVIMSHVGKRAADVSKPASKLSQTRKMNHLKDEVYREMLLLEVNRPGSEMGLALALLRATVQSESFYDHEEFGKWLRTVCPLGLQMIETSLEAGSKCGLSPA
jgi:hypothetical protein